MYADSNCAILDYSVYVVYFLEFSCPQSWRESLVWFDMPSVLSVAENIASFLCERNSEVSFAAKDPCILFGHYSVTLLLSIRITLQFSEIPLLKSVMLFHKLQVRFFFTFDRKLTMINILLVTPCRQRWTAHGTRCGQVVCPLTAP
jgi:hypothetical protein